LPSFYLRFVGSDTFPKSLSRREVEECFGLSAEDIHELRPPRFRGASKLYAWHAPEVECIAKGKSRTPYEFGVKEDIAATLKHNLIVGALAFTGNPYDGHTINAQLDQATILMQGTGCKPATAHVDLGYRGVDADNPGVAIKHRGKFKTLTAQERKLLRRRQAIEPIIGHLTADHRIDRCYLKGEQGDRLHAVLCAAGYNIR
jgi:IS5 family transposase